MPKTWFRHGVWPKFLVGLHSYTAVSFGLLVLTGTALIAPAVHRVLIPYLSLIYQVHILLGLLFAVTLLAPLSSALKGIKVIRKLDWWFPLLFGSGIVLTGILIWLVAVFPTPWRSAGFVWHGRLSIVLGVWILIHAGYKAMGYQPKARGMNPRLHVERRQFLGWIGTGLAGAAALAVLDPLALIAKVLQPGPENAAPSRFAEFYTVVSDYPAMKPADYQLEVGGLVESPRKLSFEELMDLPNYAGVSDFHCVTGWSVADAKWNGVHLSTLVGLVHPMPAAAYVHFYSFDGSYSESLSLQEALDPTVLLAYGLDSQPLRREQGYPLRLVVPKMYGYKSIKWVNRIEFSDKPLRGYWEVRGYPDEAYI